MPKFAGLLSIVAGAVGILGGVVITTMFTIINRFHYFNQIEDLAQASPIWILFISIYFLIGVIAVAGGVFAVKRRSWAAAVAGSICSILTVWGWALGIISLVFLIVSKEEFRLTGGEQ
jgi:hypothetical protein